MTAELFAKMVPPFLEKLWSNLSQNRYMIIFISGSKSEEVIC